MGIPPPRLAAPPLLLLFLLLADPRLAWILKGRRGHIARRNVCVCVGGRGSSPGANLDWRGPSFHTPHPPHFSGLWGRGLSRAFPTFQVSQTFRALGIYDIPHLNSISRTGWGSPHSPFTSSQGCDVSALLRIGLDLHTLAGGLSCPQEEYLLGERTPRYRGPRAGVGPI